MTFNSMRNNKFTQYWNCLEMGTIVFALAATIVGGVLPAAASAQDEER